MTKGKGRPREEPHTTDDAATEAASAARASEPGATTGVAMSHTIIVAFIPFKVSIKRLEATFKQLSPHFESSKRHFRSTWTTTEDKPLGMSTNEPAFHGTAMFKQMLQSAPAMSAAARPFAMSNTRLPFTAASSDDSHNHTVGNLRDIAQSLQKRVGPALQNIEEIPAGPTYTRAEEAQLTEASQFLLSRYDLQE